MISWPPTENHQSWKMVYWQLGIKHHQLQGMLTESSSYNFTIILQFIIVHSTFSLCDCFFPLLDVNIQLLDLLPFFVGPLTLQNVLWMSMWLKSASWHPSQSMLQGELPGSKLEGEIAAPLLKKEKRGNRNVNYCIEYVNNQIWLL